MASSSLFFLMPEPTLENTEVYKHFTFVRHFTLMVSCLIFCFKTVLVLITFLMLPKLSMIHKC